ncbi:MAG: HAMP domain-containing sensor histidine kinase, partial [Gemmatimonadaceae bacterium]
IEVSVGGGSPIFERGFDRTSPFVATRALGKSTDVVQIHVSLAEALAPSLIIGGLPRSQTPALLALLAVTSVLVLTAALQLRRERAFAALREDFVSGVSHEIRTPLAQIRLFSETLRLGRVRTDAERERSHEIIDQEARRLAHLVDNLLHFSRAERGAVRITKERVDLGRLVSDVVDHFRPMASSRRVVVETSVDPTLEAEVDPNAVRQIILNLLDNALKYGPDGQVITVSTTRRRVGILLAVSDQGPGVPVEARSRIWDRFWREEGARNSSVVGTGIGLAIVRELVTLHGGRAVVTNAVGGGARFEIRLPP